MAELVEDALMMNHLIHQAVRRDLRRFDEALGGFTAGDRERAKALAELFDRFDQMLTDHHVGEETHLWPIISGPPDDAATVAELTAEHGHMVRSLTAARAAFGQLGSTATRADADLAQQATVDLYHHADTHFTHEERDVGDLVSRSEPKALSSALRHLERNGGFAQGMWFLQWIADGTSGDDQTFLKRTVPRHVRWLSARVAGRKYGSATAAAVN